MRRHIAAVLGAAVIFCLEQGAELMWPEISAWHWWGAAGGLCLIMFACLYGHAVVRALTPFSRKSTSLTPATTRPDSPNADRLGEKIYTARKIEELLAPIKDMSSLQIQRHVAPHIGKWLRAQSVIRDMSENDNFLYAHVGTAKFGPLAYLAFRKQKWARHLETMDRGDRLAAEGRIVKLNFMGIYLDDCALVDLRKDDDPF